jgi:N-acetylglucosaminyldiphosphoundecaprenol N-acetyl-beta-D-mannosaminyltransferase
VYCILGIPVDAIGMPDVLRRIRNAAANKTRFLISTPNLNYLVTSQSDPDFRESLHLSDLCPADGISIVWISRLIGLPINYRVAGSDVFDALIADQSHANPLKAFLFGGAAGVAATACCALNAAAAGVLCVGSLCPGFGSVDQMSQGDIIANINSSGADLLVVSLGAKKGQAWLLCNHAGLQLPVRAHLGAVVNFLAGKVTRAPAFVRTLGFEWLWRIKEEPSLWSRYWNDGIVLLRLLFTRILPLAVWNCWLRLTHERQHLTVAQAQNEEAVIVSLVGSATAGQIKKVIVAFESAIATKKQIVVDFSGTRAVDARFFGLLLMLNKKLKSVGASPTLTGLSPRLEILFRLHGLGFLVSSKRRA